MNKLSINILVFTCILFLACNTEKHNKHWSYEGETAPEHWAEIEKNTQCDSQHQSPINIIETKTTINSTATDLNIMYSPNTVLNKVENNGHSIQFDFNPGDSIQYKNNTYFLKQIHFHEPAEHLINGIKYPIEIHLVHISKDNAITVLGILGMEGEKSQLFEFFESFLPIKNGEERIINQNLDLTSLFPNKKDFYSYSGSLTTPPCTENVNWIVFKEPIIISLEEVLKLKENMPLNNYRNEQPVNDRIIYHNINIE